MTDATAPHNPAAPPPEPAAAPVLNPLDPPPPPAIVPDTPRLELMVGGAIIVAFFGLFLGWAALAPLDAGALAMGQISVSGNRQAVQHREGGVVSTLNVSEGDSVRQGQILLTLSSGELRATERGVSGQVFALLAQRARLVAERDGLRAIPLPSEFANLPADDAVLAQESLRIQQLQFGARRTGRSTETGVLSQRIAQLNDQIEGYQRQIDSNEEQQRLIQEELIGMRGLAEKGYAPQTRVRALERTAAQLDGELGSLRAQIARSREAVGETRLQMVGVNTKMGEDVADQLRQIDVQLNELRPRMGELRAQIARTEVRAPASGQVVGLTIFTQGGVVQAGQTLMEIVPGDVSQVIVIQVKPTDIDNLRIGLETEVKFPGLRGASIPIIHGNVTSISADTFTVKETGASYYRAEIVVPAAEMAKLGRSGEALRPGAPAEVVILLRKRTALTYLLEPLTDNLWRSGSEQ